MYLTKYVCGVCGYGTNSLDDIFEHPCLMPNTKERNRAKPEMSKKGENDGRK